MSSAIFFKFKSQKEPQRITFDGTHLSVFELKREIIRVSQLGDGTDFDLAIYREDSNDEYDDDTAIIPRSTTVIARRLPPFKPGQGRAARYVSGRMPTTAKNSHRTEQTGQSSAVKGDTTKTGAFAMQKAQTEEERIAAMLQMGADQWEEQKQHMATAAPVYRPGGVKGKTQNVPDHPPPPEYVCYRCGVKGHWIQACPTNNDPKFDGRPRVVRTVGIPRSFLQQVEKTAAAPEDGLTDESRQPSSRWVDSEGNAVAAIADTASWEQFQAKAQASAKQQDVVASGSKELQDRGLECSIDKRLFVNPMKTPCCGKTYCHDCIETALINSDLVCPGCSTEGVLLDNLVTDDEAIAKIKAFEEEKQAEKKALEKTRASSPGKESSNTPPPRTSKSPTPTSATKQPNRADTASPSKKRRASDDLPNDRKPDAPAPTLSAATMVKTTSTSGNTDIQSTSIKPAPQAPNGVDQAFFEQMNAQMNALAGSNGAQNGINPANMPFSMPGMPNMMAMMAANPMMPMPGWNGGMPGMLPMGLMPPMPIPMNNMPMPMPMGMPGMMPQWNGAPPMNNNNGYPNMNNMMANFPNGQQQQQGRGFQQGPQQNGYMGGVGGFPNQQHSGYEDSAYMRQPVNPQRHMGRQRKVRPTDYREL